MQVASNCDSLACERATKWTEANAMIFEDAQEIDLPPNAASLIEGLRDFGYSLDTSLADIIDNSITASARRIDIFADTISNDPWIAIVDNGAGMSRGDLLEALRLGTKNPRNERDQHDLGRFGLGLKSASFSQCRQLIVVSRRDGLTSAAAWDLDQVEETNKFSASILNNPSAVPAVEHLGNSGTAVIWKKLDRLDGGYTTDSALRTKTLNAALANAERHLRLVFHRYLGGTAPRVSIYLNHTKLEPIDPFAEGHPARQVEPEEYLELKKGIVTFRAVTLPHHKKMTQEEWDEIGGPTGHQASQGLYVYRADRLIIAGGWLGLAKPLESTKLCRIAVDIPNSMDDDWKIDVKKASAQLPPLVRKKLKNIVERFVSTSKRTYSRRGRRLVSEEQLPIWERISQGDKIIFKPDLYHPVFQSFREQLSEDLSRDFDACIRLIGSTLPIETIHSDIIAGAEQVLSDDIDDAALRLQVSAVVNSLVQSGIDSNDIPNILKNVVVLRDNWDRAQQIITSCLSEVPDSE